MKQLLLIIVLLPSFCLAQTRADYEHTFARFTKFYNSGQGDSIINMWPVSEHDDWMHNTWGKNHLKSMLQEYGKILSYKYIGIDTDDPNPGLAVFKTHFSVAGWKTTSFTLEKGNYLSTFRFITSSDGINKLLKKEK